jgi:transaldolase/glucose-6-phosphate isomerase
VFLQITCDDRIELPVPGQKYSFSVVKAAQARGDFDVLAERDRRALRIHMGLDLPRDIDRLSGALRLAVM